MAAAAAVALTATTASVAAAAPPADRGANNNTVRKLTAAVSAEGVLEHLQALQAIADASGGTRVSGSIGYDRSAEYAAEVFRDAGYDTEIQEFDFTTFVTTGPTVFRQVTPGPERDLEAIIMSYSGSGTERLAASLPAGTGATSSLGCAATDFGPANVGTIVLISRGTCAFGAKAANAEAAGAAGVVIYNNTAGPLNGTLGSSFTGDLSVVGVTQELGQTLVGLVEDGLTLQLETSTLREVKTTSNVIAQTAGGNTDNVVMVGAHLDSVEEGPGSNDNGSGAGAILEVAQQMAKTKTTNAVRFALWGAEESGLVGATEYVSGLSDDELEQIALYLNFDMVASPNYVRFVYDGDDSAKDGNIGPAGSAPIEKAFIDYFASQGLASDPTDFSGRSDYGPFIAVGIPSGGLFTGAEGTKTAAQAKVYGGVAGAAYDPCYHQACDSLRQSFGADAAKAALYAQLDAEYPLIGNINMQALEEMSNAIAAVTLTYAYDTSSVNGVAGAPGKRKGIFKTGGNGGHGGTTGTADGSGGGLHADHDHELDAS